MPVVILCLHDRVLNAWIPSHKLITDRGSTVTTVQLHSSTSLQPTATSRTTLSFICTTPVVDAAVAMLERYSLKNAGEGQAVLNCDAKVVHTTCYASIKTHSLNHAGSGTDTHPQWEAMHLPPAYAGSSLT